MAQVSFKGYISKVREPQFNAEGRVRISFSVAEGHRGKVDGQYQDTGVTFWNVTVFDQKLAEGLAETLREGQKQQVNVTGRHQSREYEVNGEKRTSLDVIADSVGLVPWPQQNNQQQPTSGAQAVAAGLGGTPVASSWNQPAEDPWASSQQPAFADKPPF